MDRRVVPPDLISAGMTPSAVSKRKSTSHITLDVGLDVVHVDNMSIQMRYCPTEPFQTMPTFVSTTIMAGLLDTPRRTGRDRYRAVMPENPHSR